LDHTFNKLADLKSKGFEINNTIYVKTLNIQNERFSVLEHGLEDLKIQNNTDKKMLNSKFTEQEA
jgi:hypothetical protein